MGRVRFVYWLRSKVRPGATVWAALVAATIGVPARAANLVEWNVAGANASASNTVQVGSAALHVTAPPLVSHGNLDPPYPQVGTFLYRSWPTGATPDPSKYYQFEIAPDPGYSIQFTSLSLAVGSGSSGPVTPTTGVFQITASLDGFATPGIVIATQTFPKDAMWHAFDLDLSPLGIQAGKVSLRFSMYQVGGNAFSGLGAHPALGNQGRNLVVNGTVFQGEPPPTCVPTATTLCIDDSPGDRRFRARVAFETTQGSKPSGAAKVIPLGSLGIPSGGIFWFTNPQNPEMLLKVLNACSANGHFWVFYAAGTNFALRTEILDTTTGTTWIRTNADRNQAPPLADILAFPCAGGAASAAAGLGSEPAPDWVGALADWTDPDGASAETVELEPRAACTANANTLCIDDQTGDGRFEATVFFSTTQGNQPMGFGTAIPLTSLGVPSGGIFWFTNPQNPEMLLKVLNGCPTTGHYWVFYAAGTNFALEVEVVDTVTGRTWHSVNPDRRQAPPIADILALPCQVP